MFMRSALLAGVILLAASQAQAKTQTSPKGMLCRTQVALDSLYDFHKIYPKASLADGMAMVNESDSTAGCEMSPMIYEAGEIVETILLDDGDMLDIRKVKVIGECDDKACITSTKVGFAAFPALPTS